MHLNPLVRIFLKCTLHVLLVCRLVGCVLEHSNGGLGSSFSLFSAHSVLFMEVACAMHNMHNVVFLYAYAADGLQPTEKDFINKIHCKIISAAWQRRLNCGCLAHTNQKRRKWQQMKWRLAAAKSIAVHWIVDMHTKTIFTAMLHCVIFIRLIIIKTAKSFKLL